MAGTEPGRPSPSCRGESFMDWHRLFGLLLTDFFTGSPFVVELEKDLAIRKQLLDVVILRRGKGRFAGRLPDGLDDLADHNLITFKSHHEALDDWALKELTGHYVNYRKQASPEQAPLLPETDFRLYAVCSRYPHNLAAGVALEEVRQGVYQCRRGTDVIRVIVARQLLAAEHNAPLQLFSASADQVAYGASHYRRRSGQTSTLLEQLLKGYKGEGVAMPYTMEDFKHDYLKENLKELTPEELREALQTLSAEQLAGIENYLNERRAAATSVPQNKPAGRKGRKPPRR
jgi:hypothetical protein